MFSINLKPPIFVYYDGESVGKEVTQSYQCLAWTVSIILQEMSFYQNSIVASPEWHFYNPSQREVCSFGDVRPMHWLLRLQSIIVITGKALDWFTTYLTSRIQSILINGSKSRLLELLFGVPQGLVLEPILFITSPLGKILSSLGVGYHVCAEDRWTYISFNVNKTDAAVKNH